MHGMRVMGRECLEIDVGPFHSSWLHKLFSRSSQAADSCWPSPAPQISHIRSHGTGLCQTEWREMKMPSKYEALLTVVRVLNEQSERMERDEDAIKYEALLTVVRVLNEQSDRMERDEDAIKYEALLTVVRVLNEQSDRMERDEDAI